MKNNRLQTLSDLDGIQGLLENEAVVRGWGGFPGAVVYHLDNN